MEMLRFQSKYSQLKSDTQFFKNGFSFQENMLQSYSNENIQNFQ